jgi:hypothetical protein
MYAVIVDVHMNDRELVLEALPLVVVPLVTKVPGYVNGYWTVNDNDDGIAMIIFDNEAAAVETQGEISARMNELPDMVTLRGVEIRDVVEHADAQDAIRINAEMAALEEQDA